MHQLPTDLFILAMNTEITIIMFCNIQIQHELNYCVLFLLYYGSSSGSACSSLCDGDEPLVCSAVIYSCSSEMFSILQLNYLFLKSLCFFFKQTQFYLKEIVQKGKFRDHLLSLMSVQIYMMKIF